MEAAAKIFLSHASTDKPLADLLKTTMVLGGLAEDRIFYSSSRNSGVPSGTDIRSHLRMELNSAALVLELMSRTFFARPVCLMELGGAWALGKSSYPIVVPPLTRSEAAEHIGEVRTGLLWKDEDINEVFDELNDRIASDLGVSLRTRAWNSAVREFKTRLPSVLTEVAQPANPSPRRPSTHAGLPVGKKVEVVQYGVIQSRYGSEVHGEAINNSQKERSAIIKATFYDEARRIVGTAAGIVQQLAPGEVKTFSLTSVDDIPSHHDIKVQVDTVF